MQALLILVQIATVLINTITKLSCTGSTSSVAQLNPIQNIKLLNFDDSHLLEPLHKNTIEEKINPIFATSKSKLMVKSESVCITLSPDEAFIKIGSILGHQYACEYTMQKNRGVVQKMTSEIMGIIFWTFLILEIYLKTSNIKLLTSTSSCAYV